MYDFRKNGKKKDLQGHFSEGFVQYIDIVLIVYMFYPKILFLKLMWEKVKSKGGIADNNKNNPSLFISIYLFIYPTPLHEQNTAQGKFLSKV